MGYFTYVSDRSNVTIVPIYTQEGLLTVNWKLQTTTNRLNLAVGELVQYNIEVAIIIEACILGTFRYLIKLADKFRHLIKPIKIANFFRLSKICYFVVYKPSQILLENVRLKKSHNP